MSRLRKSIETHRPMTQQRIRSRQRIHSGVKDPKLKRFRSKTATQRLKNIEMPESGCIHDLYQNIRRKNFHRFLILLICLIFYRIT